MSESLLERIVDEDLDAMSQKNRLDVCRGECVSSWSPNLRSWP